ncbi:MAG: DUF433 domain-containing protein [Gammaproteobacteria bacterium]|jgi:uncharacterized protein (DUF433 family)|nr:MAG: DUF433 domain-containing protein [Gammaproteobacteria bacterium]RKZ40763.1 MAG: DUF433 domain-containing protein [Gammaproteobacteria bacterium]RKZ72546.1 MAG: DUF433 domain-containing protein [Gammaproteobacteria bacterium]
MEYLERITLNPEICHGKPCIRGMRWPIDVILDMLSSKMSAKDILADHPELEEEDIFASLTYARLVVSGDMIMRKIA